MHLAFYKATGTLFDKLIRLVTRSRYSHVEAVFDYRSNGNGSCWSSSARDGGIRHKAMWLDPEKWDLVDIGTSGEGAALLWFSLHEGQGYDWLGVMRYVLPFVPQSERKWFCNEAVDAALGIAGDRRSPQDLYEWSTANA